MTTESPRSSRSPHGTSSRRSSGLRLSRREAVLAALAGAAAWSVPSLAQGVASPATAAADRNFANWFKFDAKVLQNWIIDETADENLVTIRPLRPSLSLNAKKVMVIYPRPSSAYDIAITKTLEVFSSKELNAELSVMNFRNEPARAKQMLRKAEAEGYNAILSMGSETTAWLWDNYRGGKVPVVTVCSKDPVVLGQSPGYSRGSGTNFAFTSLNMPIDVQMAYIAELKPRLKNIAVLVDSRNVSAIETQAKPVIDYAKSRGLRVLELSVQDPANAKAELERMVRDATVMMTRNDPDLAGSIYWLTGSTSVFREIATINANAGRAAVISVVPELVKAGDDSAALAIGISFESNAHLAAVYTADIVTGRNKASELKVGVVTPPDMSISFRKMRDIGMTVPLSFFEAAGTIYDYEGTAVRIDGVSVAPVKT
jgi:putative tryptophan/tyrosine transport system substrate-binding protein